MNADRALTLVLAEAETMLREGLAVACEASGRYRVIGQCADGKAALRMAASLRPDVLILSGALPRLDPLELTRKLNSRSARMRVVILGNRRDRLAVLDALHAGASAYVLKTDSTRTLLEALDAVCSGSVYISPEFDLASVFSPPKPSQRRRTYEQLGFRERQVFDMVVAGLRTKDIAEQLDLSPKTISTYRVKMMAKLNIPDLPGLIRYAIRERLISV